jgi:hypothetical membrane protein
MTKNSQKIFLSFLIIAGLFLAGEVLAGLVPCGTSEHPEPCTLCHLWQLASNVINFLIFNLAVPATILLFLASGLIFLTSAGSEERIKLAKKIFTNTVIGIFIVFCSWLIIDTLLKSVAKGEFYEAWNKFPQCQQ